MSVGTAYTIVRNVVLQMATKTDFKSACELLLTVKEELYPLLKEPLEQTLSLVSEFQLPDHKVVAYLLSFGHVAAVDVGGQRHYALRFPPTTSMSMHHEHECP